MTLFSSSSSSCLDLPNKLSSLVAVAFFVFLLEGARPRLLLLLTLLLRLAPRENHDDRPSRELRVLVTTRPLLALLEAPLVGFFLAAAVVVVFLAVAAVVLDFLVVVVLASAGTVVFLTLLELETPFFLVAVVGLLLLLLEVRAARELTEAERELMVEVVELDVFLFLGVPAVPLRLAVSEAVFLTALFLVVVFVVLSDLKTRLPMDRME